MIQWEEGAGNDGQLTPSLSIISPNRIANASRVALRPGWILSAGVAHGRVLHTHHAKGLGVHYFTSAQLMSLPTDPQMVSVACHFQSSLPR